MATRRISTKLAIEGEAQYRAALKNCNIELKTLRSELGLTEEKYKNNANTLEALREKVKVLSDVYEKQGEKVKTLEKALDAAKDAYDKYSGQTESARANIERCEEALEELRGAAGDTSREQKELTEELKRYRSELQTAEEYQDAAKRGMENWQKQLNNAHTEELRLNEELEENRWYLREAADSADKCADSIDEYGHEVKEAGNESGVFGDKSEIAFKKVAVALAAAGVAKTVEEIAKALKACTDAAINFESAMAGVRKTTDLSDEEFSEMSDAIKELSTRIPATVTEIAGVVEAAGQLGIAKEDLLDFAEVMVNLGTSTNLSSEGAASSLAKFTNVVKMEPQNYERLGSTIVALGNNFATTEADVVSMATRLASTGEIVGLTEPQIMAVATALSSVGIEAEAGGSAVSKLLKQMETAAQTYGTARLTIDATGHSLRELELIASNDSGSFKALADEMGLTTTELKNYMSTASDLEDFADVSGMAAQDFIKAWGTDAVGALGKFITGLGKINEAGGSSVAVLQDMGITEIRLSNAVQSLASSNGILEKALGTANTAWEENNALAKEATTRYETTESKLQMAKNSFENLKIAAGDLFLPVLKDVADAATGAFQWTAELIDQIPKIETVAERLAANAGPSLEELTKTAKKAGDSIDLSTQKYEETSARIDATASITERYISRLKELGDYTGLNNDQQEEYRGILRLLCEAIPEVSELIDIENGYIEGGTDALEALTEAWKVNAKTQALQEYLTTLYKAHADVLMDAQIAQDKLTDATDRAKAADEKAAVLTERKNEIWREAKRLADDLNEAEGTTIHTAQSVMDRLGAECDEYWELNDAIAHEITVREQARNEAEKYQTALDGDKEAVEAAQAAIDEAETAISELTGAMEENTGAAENNAEALGKTAEAADDAKAKQQELIEAIGELETQYRETTETVRESVMRQIDLFGQLDEKGETTIQNIIANMQAQADAMEKYADNIALATERGVDQGIIEKLSDGSEESAKILSAIVSGSEKQISELNTAFGRVEEGTDTFARAVAEAETKAKAAMLGVKDAWQSAVDDMDQYKRAYENAKHTMKGLRDGLADYKPVVFGEMSDVGSGMDSAYRSALGIHSPSTKMKENMRLTIEGAIVGAEKYKADLEKAHKELAEAALRAYETAIPPESTWPGSPAPQQGTSEQMAYDMKMLLQELRQLTAQTSDMGTASGIGPNSVFVLKLDNSVELARWVLGDLISVADANGTPIKNPQ